MIAYDSIQQLISCNNSPSDTDFDYIEDMLSGWQQVYGLNLEPDFQRGHVWNEKQQIKFVEYLIRGGKCAPLLFNSPVFGGHGTSFRELPEEIVIVDGLQRLTAILKFINNQLPVFDGNYLRDFDDPGKLCRRTYIQYNVNHLQTRKELLQWYLEMNEGHIAHTEEELNRVKVLLKNS